jgi:hypothetical protein
MITDIVKGEIAAMPIPSFSKHILDIMEDEETVTIVFAKPHAMPQEDGMKEDEEEMQEESAHDMDEQDDEERALLKALLTINEGRQ